MMHATTGTFTPPWCLLQAVRQIQLRESGRSLVTVQRQQKPEEWCHINIIREDLFPVKGPSKGERQQRARPVQKAHRLPIGVLLDHGQVGVQADAHGGIKRHLEGCAVVLGPDHWPQLLAVHRLLHFLEEPLESLPVSVCLELQSGTRNTAQRKTKTCSSTARNSGRFLLLS